MGADMRRVILITVAILFLAMTVTAQVPGAMSLGLPCCGISTANGPTSQNFVSAGNGSFHARVSIGHNPNVQVNFGGNHHHHHQGVVLGGGYPYYSPYYPYYVPTLTPTQPAPEAEADSADAEPPGFTVFERRKEYQLTNTEDRGSRYGEHRFDEKPSTASAGDLDPHAQLRAEAAKSETVEPSENVITILVYRDGHQRELHDYAITGGAIYDLSRHPGQGSNKILLAELDLPATAKLNQERGVDFNLPKR